MRISIAVDIGMTSKTVVVLLLAFAFGAVQNFSVLLADIGVLFVLKCSAEVCLHLTCGLWQVIQVISEFIPSTFALNARRAIAIINCACAPLYLRQINVHNIFQRHTGLKNLESLFRLQHTHTLHDIADRHSFASGGNFADLQWHNQCIGWYW